MDGSPLAEYIDACVLNERTLWGAPDYGYANSLSTTSEAGTVENAVIGSIPVVGGILDAADQVIIAKHFDYVSGEGCSDGYEKSTQYVHEDGTVDDYKDLSYNVASADDAKVFSTFLKDLDQAVVEGYIDENPLDEYAARYYKKHPLDNSYEGIIARYSGLPKDEVVATLAFIDLANFLADYEPSGLYPTPQEGPDSKDIEVQPDPSMPFDIDSNIVASSSCDKRKLFCFSA